MKLIHATGPNRFGTVNQRARRRQIVLRPSAWRSSTRNELKGEVGQPCQGALVLAQDLQEGFRMHHPIQGRLHHDWHVADHGQDETRD